jgi:hypothetical protein
MQHQLVIERPSIVTVTVVPTEHVPELRDWKSPPQPRGKHKQIRMKLLDKGVNLPLIRQDYVASPSTRPYETFTDIPLLESSLIRAFCYGRIELRKRLWYPTDAQQTMLLHFINKILPQLVSAVRSKEH